MVNGYLRPDEFLDHQTVIKMKMIFVFFLRPIYYHGLDLIKDKVIKRGCE